MSLSAWGSSFYMETKSVDSIAQWSVPGGFGKGGMVEVPLLQVIYFSKYHK